MTTLIITFKCPNDDTEIEVRLPVVGKQMSLDKLDAIPFLFIARSVSSKDRYKGVVDLEFDGRARIAKHVFCSANTTRNREVLWRYFSLHPKNPVFNGPGAFTTCS